MSIKSTHHNIKENLSEVRKRIQENYELQKIFPEQKGLIINLKSLLHMEKDLIEDLENLYLQSNADIFELHLSGRKISNSAIPISDLGKILYNTQETITSLSSEMPIAKRAMIAEELVKSTQLYLVATSTGSFKAIISPIQSELFDSSIESSETPLKKAFANFEQLVSCGDNKDLLINQINKIGYKSILNYKNFLKSLYENNVEIELIGKSKDNIDLEVLKLRSSQSKKIYEVIHSQKESPKKEKQVIGILKAVDLLNHTFKFLIKTEKEKKIISGKFDKELESQIEDRLNKISKIIITYWIDVHELEGEEINKFFLKGFVD